VIESLQNIWAKPLDSYGFVLYELFEATKWHLLCRQWKDRNLSDLIKNIFICVSKINESLTDLERHDDNFG